MKNLLDALREIAPESPAEEVRQAAERIIVFADELEDDQAAEGLKTLARRALGRSGSN